MLDLLGIKTLFQLGIAVSAHAALAGGISRVSQGEHIHMDFVAPASSATPVTVPLQVDGEAYLLVNPKSITISKATSAMLLRSATRRP